MFYLECRDNFSESDIREHHSAMFGKEYKEMTEEEKKIADILYPLCKQKILKDLRDFFYHIKHT